MTDGDSIADLVANLDADLDDDDALFQEVEDDDEEKLDNESVDMLGLDDDDDPVDYTNRMDGYMQLLVESCEKLSMIDGGYKGKLMAYIAKRNEESELYRNVTHTQVIGTDCNIQEVNKRTSRMSWIGSSGIHGPAWRRGMLRRPKIKIRGLTDEEARRVNKNRSDRALWNLILAGIEDLREEADCAPSQLAQEEIAKTHFKNGDFHLLRKIPTKWQQQLSMNRWSKGIFFPWDLNSPSAEFPYRPALDTKKRPSANVIKDDVQYSRYMPYDVTTNRYTHLSGGKELKDQFTVHWRMKCLEKADRALAEAKKKKEEAKRKREAEHIAAEKQKKKENRMTKRNSAPTAASLLDKEVLPDITETDDYSFDDTCSIPAGYKALLPMQKQKKKSFFQKAWGRGKDAADEPIEDTALFPLDKGGQGQNDSQSVITLRTHSHVGERGDDAEEMMDPSQSDGGQESQQDVAAGSGDEGLPNPENGEDLHTQGQGSQSGRSTLTPLGINRKYTDTPRREESFLWKTPHPAEAKGRLKSEMARRKMKKQGLLRRLSGMFHKRKANPGDGKVVPSDGTLTVAPKLDSSATIGTNRKLPNSGHAPSGDHSAKTPLHAAGSSDPQLLQTESPDGKETNKKKKKSATKIVGRRCDSTASERVASSPVLKKRKKGDDGIVRTKNSAFAVATSNPHRPKKKKKKVVEDDVLPPVEEVNADEEPRTLLGKIKKVVISGKNAYSEFKVGAQDNEYQSTIFAQPPSIADKKFVETLCAVRAIQRGTARRLRILLKIFTLGLLGSDPDGDGYTPEQLKQAALFGHYKRVVDILDHWSGVTPNDRCEADGDTPFIAAVVRALEGEAMEEECFTMDVGIAGVINKIKKWFRRAKRGGGKLDLCVKILALRGGDVNVVKNDRGEGDGYALIHIAAERNIVDLAKWLHARNVDIHRPSSVLRRTALMVAARKGHGDMVHRLLHMGGIDSINHQDAGGWSALHLVAAYCEPEYVEMMLICGADPGVRHEGNRLPLEEAQARGRLDSVQAIMSYKDRSRAFRHQISYFNEEAKRGRTMSQDDNSSVGIAGSIASASSDLRDLGGKFARGMSMRVQQLGSA